MSDFGNEKQFCRVQIVSSVEWKMFLQVSCLNFHWWCSALCQMFHVVVSRTSSSLPFMSLSTFPIFRLLLLPTFSAFEWGNLNMKNSPKHTHTTWHDQFPAKYLSSYEAWRRCALHECHPINWKETNVENIVIGTWSRNQICFKFPGYMRMAHGDDSWYTHKRGLNVNEKNSNQHLNIEQQYVTSFPFHILIIRLHVSSKSSNRHCVNLLPK